ncbi:MAG: caspase family protein [Bacteroidales bacterium]|nr:caspase family protein [Bacteroidales bacterium]
MKRILLVFVSLSVALTMLAQNKGTSSTGGLEVVKDAKHPVLQLGDKARCTLTDDGTLVVEGFGILKGARNEKGAPLVKKKINQKIKNIDLTHFSGTLGDYVFYGIDELDAVILNDSALYRFSPRAFWPDIRIGTLEFVNVRNGEKDYRIITNYLPSQESKRCDISSFKDNIQRCIVVRRDHYLADTATIGKKHTGRGLRRWTDRNNGMRLYYGDWVNGEMDGAGIAIMFDGTVRMGQWNENICTGHPEAVGVDLFLDCPEILPLQLIAQHHVEQAVNKWQRKEDYETAKEWGARVNNSSRQQRAIMEYNLLVDRYMKAEASKTDIAFRLGSYDVNHNTYMLSDATYGNIPIALTNAISAAQFKTEWDSLIKTPTYYFDGEKMALWDLTVWKDGTRVAFYRNGAQPRHDNTPADYNFNPIELPIVHTYPVVPSDVDIDIPETQRKDPSTFVFIIANENYVTQRVPYALNDGNIFKRYCEKTLGIAPNHIKIYADATYGRIMECVSMARQTAEAYDGEVTLLFYYAGHAIPDERCDDAYLLPIDGSPRMPETAYSLNKLYNELGSINARAVVCFMDACFSGTTREGSALLATRGFRLTDKNNTPKGNMVVFTSSSEDESSLMYEEKSHGLFTYFLLKKIKETKGAVTLGEMADYLTREVKRASSTVNQIIQTPKVLVSPALYNTWRDIAL